MNEANDRAEQIFQTAAEMECRQKRDAYLDDACSGDAQLRNELEDLLQHDDQAQSFLDGPALHAPIIGEASICESPGTIIGPYKLLEQIGEGAFGLVFVAEQQEPVRRKVALKIIKPGMDTKEVIARFEAERQALALMAHPNICQVFDAGATESGRPYFAMELVKGVSITEYCDYRETSIRERLQIFVSVCRAVQHAHAKAVIHRDLKPSNILVSPHDGVPVVKIIDFGIAKAIEHQLTDKTIYTQFSQMLGTPLYMSPEQAEINALDVDTRSDVYSLGVLLYELLTGTTPFERERFSAATYDELRRIIRHETPPKPSTRLSTISSTLPTVSAKRKTEPVKLLNAIKGELDCLVMKSLEKDRSRRYESANSLANDVERYLRNEPVLARPPSSLYLIRKFTQRHRLLVVSIVAVVVALVTGLSVATYGLREAHRNIDALTEEQENNRIMLRLFRDMYGIPWGMEAYGHEHTMRASVDDISEGLDERLKEHPQVEIEIRQVFANVYRNTGELEKARRHLEIALTRAESVYGPNHKVVADILTDLAAEIDTRGNTMEFSLARDYAERALATYEGLGIETARTSHAWLCKARSIQADPMLLSETDDCLHQALRIARDISHGKKTTNQVFSLWDLAMHLARTSKQHDRVRLGKASDFIRESVEMSRAFPDQPTLIATVLSGQGECLRRQGDSKAAIASYKEAWDIYRRDDLQNEPRGHRTALDLAEIYLVQSQHRQAHEFLMDLESLCRDHKAWETLTECLCLQGWGHLIREDYDSAAACLRKSVATAEQHLSQTSEANAFAHFYFARTLVALGKVEEARKHFEKVLALTELLLPSEDDPDVQMVLFGHAWSLIHCNVTDEDGKLSKAFKIAKRGRSLASVHSPWQEPHFSLAMAMSQQKLGHEDAAIKHLEEGLAKCQVPFPSLHAYRQDVPTSRRDLETALAKLYLKRGQTRDKEEARQRYVEGVEARKKHFPPGHLQVALADLRLGTFLREQGETEAARTLLRSVQSKLQINPEASEANQTLVAKQLEQLN